MAAMNRCPRRARAEPGDTEHPSRNEQHLPRRLATLERAVSLGGVLQRVLELRAETKLAVADPAQHFTGAPLKVFTRGDVMVETGTRQVERALGVEDLGIDLPDGAARLSVGGHEAPRGSATSSPEAWPQRPVSC